MSARQYDLVLWGASGYTGQYTAEHIAIHFSTNFNWAIAGRSRDKLLNIARGIKKLNPDRKEPAIEIAQLRDDDLDALAKKTRLIINTVGPYCKYGEPVVRACAQNGTHYVDVTGEPPWVRDMVLRYHEKAKETGAIIIPEIGLESAPADMITYALAKCIKNKLSTTTREVILTTHILKMSASGGTLSTVREIFNHYSLLDLVKSGLPGATCPVSLPKHSSPGILQRLLGIRTVPDLGTLTTSIQASADTPIVYRSWGLHSLEGESYGPNFRFSPHMSVRNAFLGALVHVALVIGPLMVALPPVRWLLGKISYAAGSGPDREQAKNGYVEWRALGYPDVQAGQKAFARMKFSGSGYHMTGIVLAEGARTILSETNTLAQKLGGGVLTPATLGQQYLDNLERAGLPIETKLMSA